MGTFFQQYGVEEARRNRIIRNIILSCVGLLVLGIVGYFVFHDYSEKQVAKRFLADVNAHRYEEAYRDWGCSRQHPCPNYDYGRFMEDWGPAKKITSPWTISSVDSCRSFLTLNVKAAGAEVQSLSVQRSDGSLGYAPAPECQEKMWRWGQFFNRILGRSSDKS
jgi:hypothetical protein